ncbi:MAG: Cys-tRNA(Pro) deacylase [Anaerolineae bacterium]|nr:Cys-tRNA(Pro) deacylase [Anaerolineae bacterium]
MPKPKKTVAMRQLDNLRVPYEATWHPPTYDAESAALESGIPLAQIVKSLLVQLPGRRYVLALVPGDRKLSLHKLGTALGQKGLEMAPHDEVATITGYEPGSVSPLGLKRKLSIVVDDTVLALERASISGGRHEAGITLAPADLVRATGAKVADITQ